MGVELKITWLELLSVSHSRARPACHCPQAPICRHRSCSCRSGPNNLVKLSHVYKGLLDHTAVRAAEPVVQHTLDPLVYEGPALGWPEDQWRQRDGFEPPEPQTPADLLDYLRHHPGWHGKDALLTATRFPDHRWNAEIKCLIDSGHVEREGERRGARYRFRGA